MGVSRQARPGQIVPGEVAPLPEDWVWKCRAGRAAAGPQVGPPRGIAKTKIGPP